MSILADIINLVIYIFTSSLCLYVEAQHF
jgi:hypothetical protein